MMELRLQYNAVDQGSMIAIPLDLSSTESLRQTVTEACLVPRESMHNTESSCVLVATHFHLAFMPHQSGDVEKGVTGSGFSLLAELLEEIDGYCRPHCTFTSSILLIWPWPEIAQRATLSENNTSR